MDPTPVDRPARRVVPWAVAAVVAAAGLAAVLLFGDGTAAVRPPRPGSVAAAEDTRVELPRGDPAAARLTAAGWDGAAAEAVVDMHRDLLAAADPPARERLLDTLAELHKYPRAMPLLRAYPELAGAMCETPDLLSAALHRPAADVPLVLAVALAAPDPGDRELVLAAVGRHGDLVGRLHRAGLPGAEAAFAFPATTDADQAYDAWLAAVLDARLRADDDPAAFLLLALAHGDALRARLRDAAFRAGFADRLWPTLDRLCRWPDHPLELYLAEPAVWDVLARPGGEALLRDRGLVAVELLYGRRPWPAGLHDRVARMAVVGGEETLCGLLDGPFRDEPLFRQILAADLSDAVLAQAVARLQAAGDRYAGPLNKLAAAKDSPAAFAALLGPPHHGPVEWLPFYVHVVVARKLLEGERVSDEEWGDLAVDTAMQVLPGGSGGKVLVQQLSKAAAKKQAERMVARRLGTGLAGKLVAHEASRAWHHAAAAGLLTQFGEVVRAARALAAVEVTGVVRALYARSHLGRAWFRRLTDLEARVFMRADGRVVLHCDRLAAAWAADHLKRTALEAARDGAAGGDAARRNLAAVFSLRAAGLLTPAPEVTP